MASVSTIRVKHKVFKREMVINESDFDEKLHEKVGVETKEPAKKKKEKDVDEELKALMGA